MGIGQFIAPSPPPLLLPPLRSTPLLPLPPPFPPFPSFFPPSLRFPIRPSPVANLPELPPTWRQRAQRRCCRASGASVTCRAGTSSTCTTTTTASATKPSRSGGEWMGWAQQRIPGNKGFARRFEYCTLVRHYFGDRWYALAQIGFNAGLLASNIASMIVTSQVLDSVVYRLAGTSYGMDYGQWPPAFIESLATGGAGGNVCAWGTTSSGDCNRSVISLGFVLAMAVCIPFARLNLDDNMGFQWLSMLAQLLFSFEFAAQFLSNLLPGSPNYCAGNGPGRTPFLGLDISQVLGVCVFAYSYVSTIPSWANEKKPGVNVNRAIWLPASVGCALNILLGLLGAWAYKLVDDAGHPFKGTDNMLNMLDGQADAATACGHPHVAPATEFSVYMWGFFGYIPGIPILAIMVRYNLQASGLFSDSAAFFWAVVAPWLLTAFFYQAQVLVQFCNWVAIICQGFINLVVPTLLFRAALITYPTPEELESRGYLLVSSSPPSSTPLSTTPPASTPLRTSSSADRSLVGLIQNVIAALSPKHSPSSSQGGAGVMESDMEGAGAYKQMPDSAGGEVGREGDVIVEGARVVVDSESDSGSRDDVDNRATGSCQHRHHPPLSVTLLPRALEPVELVD
ncbi:unnamed protein product [Closterium sp. NIES-65]|nr:unnamed protein product [Closterium sp. NIES-65]